MRSFLYLCVFLHIFVDTDPFWFETVIRYHDYFVNPNNISSSGSSTLGSCVIYIVMEYLEGPTLVDALATRKFLTEDDVKVVLEKLLDAVNYMHLNGGT